METFGTPGKHLIDDIVKGFSLTGLARCSGILLPKVSTPASSAEDVKKSSVSVSKAILNSMRPCDDPLVNLAVWSDTIQERDKG